MGAKHRVMSDNMSSHYRHTKKRRALKSVARSTGRRIAGMPSHDSDQVNGTAANGTRPSLLGRILGGRLAFLAVSAVQKALPLLILPFLTAILGPEKYGEVAVLISCFTLVSMTFGLGLETVMYRYGSLKNPQAKSYIAAAALLQRFVPILIGLLLGLSIHALDVRVGGASAQHVALAVIAASVYCSAWQFPASLARVVGRFRTYFAYALTYSFILAGFKLLFVVVLNLGVQGWVLADVTASTCLFILTFRDFLPFLRSFRARKTYLHMGPPMRLGGPLVINAISQWIVGSFDRILIAVILGATSAGHYALAAQVVTIGGVIIAELTKYVQPHLSPAKELPAREVLLKVAPRQVVLVALICMLTAALGAYIAPFIFGEAFGNLGYFSALMAAPLVLNGLSYLGIEYMSITRGKTRSIAFLSLFTSALSVLLNILLLPRMGISGAVVTLAATAVLTFVIVWAPIIRSDLGTKASAQLFWPAAVGVVMILSAALMVAGR